ncbi:unnamed protein product, partial [Rotaria sordida]
DEQNQALSDIKQILDDNTKLREDNIRFEKKFAELQDDNTKLRENNTKLQEEFAKLNDDFQKFREDISC